MLKDRYLIVGGSAGIGLAVARQLQAGGAEVIIAARSQERFQLAASQLNAGTQFGIEVLPAISANSNLINFAFKNENGLEEAVFRRADHRYFAADGDWRSDQKLRLQVAFSEALFYNYLAKFGDMMAAHSNILQVPVYQGDLPS